MLGCSSFSHTKKTTLDSCEIPPSPSRIQAIIESQHKNCRLRFLLLLPEEDYQKCLFFSRKDWIWARKSKFPGKLIIERFEDVSSLPYIIEGVPMPRQLYIMLPKEKLFIHSNQFTTRYIESKLNELKQLFVLLKARSIKFSSNRMQKDQSTIGSGITLPIEGIVSETQVNKMDLVANERVSEMHFTESNTEISIEDKLMETDFYYLSREFHWQDIISRRIENHLVYDKYVYKNHEMNLFQAKTQNQLKKMGLNIEYDWEKMKHLEIHYEIEYYPL